MIKRETPFLLCEAICEAVRHRLPEALATDSSFFFDYEGCVPITTADPSAVHAIVDRLLRHALRTLRDGAFFRVSVEPSDAEHCRVQLRLATASATGEREPSGAVPHDLPPDDADLTVVRALCRALGGDLSVVEDPVGVLTQAEFEVPVFEPSISQPDVQADGASAWLIGSPTYVMKMLARRLVRLGWRVRIFGTVAEAEEGLRNGGLPMLVIGSEHRGVSRAELVGLRAQLPSAARVVLQVLQHMDAESRPAAGIDVLAIPLSPRRLMHYTELARRQGVRSPGHTRAGALESAGSGSVLVVDDNAVNRILAEEMVRMLGYRVVSTTTGEEAIDQCLADTPALVLMDLNMPGMGGLAAARHLRDLQSAGRLPDFAMWMVSATRPAEVAHLVPRPFDGAMPKPIDILTLRELLKRSAPPQSNPQPPAA